MSDYEVSFTVVEDMIDRLPTKLKRSDSPYSIKNLITLYGEIAQRREIIISDLYGILNNPDLAYGWFLDRLGGLVGEARKGRNDPTYRLWIKARRFANQSNGRWSDFVNIVRVLDPGAFASYKEWPHELEVLVTSLSIDASQLYQIFLEAKTGGVVLGMNYSSHPATEIFTLDTGPGLDVGHLVDSLP